MNHMMKYVLNMIKFLRNWKVNNGALHVSYK